MLCPNTCMIELICFSAYLQSSSEQHRHRSNRGPRISLDTEFAVCRSAFRAFCVHERANSLHCQESVELRSASRPSASANPPLSHNMQFYSAKIRMYNLSFCCFKSFAAISSQCFITSDFFATNFLSRCSFNLRNLSRGDSSCSISIFSAKRPRVKCPRILSSVWR